MTARITPARTYLVISLGEIKALERFIRREHRPADDTACAVLTFDVYPDAPFKNQAHDVLVRVPSGPDHRLNYATMTHHPVIQQEPRT
jgi:hypothetical protein